MKRVSLGRTFIGVVEDNLDPKKLGRCKIRVFDIFDNTPIANIPWANQWKDLAGNQFEVPEKGKVVTVVFENGSTDAPEYIFSEHYNINLEKKLAGLSDSDYVSMKSLIFDHKTQVYVNDSEGLKLDHKFNMINIRETSINVNLKDNFGKINLGTANSTQRAILGDNFLNWFDDFVQILMGSKGGPFLGNLGAPVVATPALLGSLQLYQQLKDPKFLSKNVYIVDNENVDKLDRIAEGQIGDTWNSTVKNNDQVSKEPVPFTPTPGTTNTTFDQPPAQSPIAPTQSVQPEQSKPTPKENPDVKIIKELLTYKKYILYEDTMKMNIVAVRNQCILPGDKYTDSFTDKLYLLYKKEDSTWDVKQYVFSTVPGLEFMITDSWIEEKNLKNVEPWKNSKGKNIFMKEYISIVGKNGDRDLQKGLKILAPSQYIDMYYISQYKGAKSMNVVPGATQLIWRDKDTTNIDSFNPENYTSPESTVSSVLADDGLKIHLGYPGGMKVGSWSEGSQVFSNSENLNDFFNLCEKHKQKFGNSFTYTLVTKTDWDEATRIAEANKASDPLTPQQIIATQSETSGVSGTQSQNTNGLTDTFKGNNSEVVDVVGDGSLMVDIQISEAFRNSKITSDDLKRESQNITNDLQESIVLTIKSQSIDNQWIFKSSTVTNRAPQNEKFDLKVTDSGTLTQSKVVFDIGKLNKFWVVENGVSTFNQSGQGITYGNYTIILFIQMENTLLSSGSPDKEKTVRKEIRFEVQSGSLSSSTSNQNSDINEVIIGILNPKTTSAKAVTGKITFRQLGEKIETTGIITNLPSTTNGVPGGIIGPITSESTSTSSKDTLVEEMIIKLEDQMVKYFGTIDLVILEKR